MCDINKWRDFQGQFACNEKNWLLVSLPESATIYPDNISTHLMGP